jgi:hypothetical protein
MFWGILTTDVDYTRPATREETAEYTFNALGQYFNPNDPSAVRFVTWDTNRQQYHPLEIPSQQNIFLRVYNQGPVWLDVVGARDAFGRPGREWTIGADLIGIYIDTPSHVFTADTSNSAMASALTRYSIATPTSFEEVIVIEEENITRRVTRLTDRSRSFVNGLRLMPGIMNTDYIADKTGNGVLVEVFSTGRRVITDVVAIRTEIARVETINTAGEWVRLEVLTRLSDQDKGQVRVISNFQHPLVMPNGDEIDVPVSDLARVDRVDNAVAYDILAGLEIDDLVLMRPSWDVDEREWVVEEVAIPEIVTGPVTSRLGSGTGRGTVTVGGTQYAPAFSRDMDNEKPKPAVPPQAPVDDDRYGESGTVMAIRPSAHESILVLDEFGYVAAIKDGEPPEPVAVLVVEHFFVTVDGRMRPMATVVMPNGEVVDVRVRDHDSGLGVRRIISTDGGIFSFHTEANTGQHSPVPNIADIIAADGSVIPLRPGAEINRNDLRLTSTLTSLLPTHQQYRNAFASDVTFIYWTRDVNREISFSVRTGVHTVTLPQSPFESWAVITGDNQRVTTVFIQDVSVFEDTAIVYFRSGDIIVDQRWVDGTLWTWYEAWSDGVPVTGGIPMFARPHADTFYTPSERSDGRFARVPDNSAISLDPEDHGITGSVEDDRIGRVRDTDNRILTEEVVRPAQRELPGVIHFGGARNLEVIFDRDTRIVDLRRDVENRTHQISESLGGLNAALDPVTSPFTSLTLSVVFTASNANLDSGFGRATVIYIVDSDPDGRN